MSHFVTHDYQQGYSTAGPKHRPTFSVRNPPASRRRSGGGQGGRGAAVRCCRPGGAARRGRQRGPLSGSAFPSHRRPGELCKDSGLRSGRLLEPAPVSLLPPERGKTVRAAAGGEALPGLFRERELHLSRPRREKDKYAALCHFTWPDSTVG